VVSLAAAPSSDASCYRAVAAVIGVIALFTIITSVGSSRAAQSTGSSSVPTSPPLGSRRSQALR